MAARLQRVLFSSCNQHAGIGSQPRDARANTDRFSWASLVGMKELPQFALRCVIRVGDLHGRVTPTRGGDTQWDDL